MPNENQDIDPAPRRSLRRRAMKIGATANSVLAMSGILASPVMASEKPVKPKPTPAETQQQGDLERAAEIAARLIGVSKEQLSARGLRRVEDLPGYEKKVSPEIRRKLAESTMRMVWRSKTASGNTPWQEWCTVTKIATHGKSYGVVAGHCFPTANANFKDADAWPAQNIIGAMMNDYAIAKDDVQNPIAIVKGISVMAPGGSDFALVDIEAMTNEGGDGMTDFNSIPALDYDAPQKAPIPGEQVALFSKPVASKLPVMATGRWLGRKWMGGLNGRQLVDIVGIDPYEPKDDACNYGASGSSAIAAGGFITGPLSMRNNIGYQSGKMNSSGNDADSRMVVKYRINDFERELGIRMERFARSVSTTSG
ncbi:MAG: hypothetical protein AAB541_04200 [Patescibacteria group bacterium]